MHKVHYYLFLVRGESRVANDGVARESSQDVKTCLKMMGHTLQAWDVFQCLKVTHRKNVRSLVRILSVRKRVVI